MREERVTKAGIKEKMGESKWQSPSHQVSIECDNPRGGTYRRRVAGIKTAKIFGGHVKGPLTDKAIDKYVQSGLYEMRHAMLSANREKRLVYDTEKQEFVMR